MITLAVQGAAESLSEVLLDRDVFSLKYPAEWTVQKDYDESDTQPSLFIFGENEGWFTFSLDDDIEGTKQQIDKSAKFFSKAFSDPEIIDFHHYGRYVGYGKIIRNKQKGTTDHRLSRLFVCTKCEVPFYLNELQANSVSRSVKARFELIENSLRIKPRKPTTLSIR